MHIIIFLCEKKNICAFMKQGSLFLGQISYVLNSVLVICKNQKWCYIVKNLCLPLII